MGARLRLKAGSDISAFAPEVQRIFRAMKRYGLIVADNGSDMYISGTMDARWNNDVLNPAFAALTADDFEVIQLGWGAGDAAEPADQAADRAVGRQTVSGRLGERGRSGGRGRRSPVVARHSSRNRPAAGARQRRRRRRRLDRVAARCSSAGRPAATAHLAAPDRGQHADDPAHHLPEEVRALHADEHQLAVLDDLEALDQHAASISPRGRRP